MCTPARGSIYIYIYIDIQEPKSKKVKMQEFNLRKTRKHSTCYKPGRSKTLYEKVCMGFIFPQTYSKLAVGPLAQTLCFCHKNSTFRENGCSSFRKVEDLMPSNIMSSEPRHWMVLGRLVMPACAVLCWGTAAADASAQHCTTQAWPTGQIPSSAWLRWHIMFLGIRESRRNWHINNYLAWKLI